MENIVIILSSYGWIGIAVVALAEAIFLPIPMDSISIPIYLLNRDRAILYSVILIFFSMIGSSVGYFIGKKFGKTILEKFISEKIMNKMEKLYKDNSSFALMSSAFTPIPYEAYVVSAGVFDIKFSKFIFYAFISRIIRHLPQGILIQFFGEYIIAQLKNYSVAIFIAFLLALILKLVCKHIKNRKVRRMLNLR